MRKIVILILILLPFLGSAQNCNCADNFKTLVEKVKNNYVGYRDKITPSNQQQFDVITDSLQRIANVSEKMACFDLCAEWLTFFKDGHLMMYFTPQEGTTPNAIKDFLATSEKTNWNEADFDTYLKSNNDKLDEIEGYWTYSAGNYKIGIVRDTVNGNNEFVGFIIKTTNPYWMPQQVKLRIKKVKGNYQILYTRSIDHSKVFPSILVEQDQIDLGSSGKWYRSKFPENETVTPAQPVVLPFFKVLDKETNILVLPSFSIQYKKAVDSIIERNENLLKKSKHLIIDLRNNGGGLTGTFKKLLPYLYTNPIYSSGGALLVTTDNLNARYKSDMSRFSEETKRRLQKDYEKAKDHIGEFYPLYPADTTKFSHVFKYPKRISILMNEGSASSAEILILMAEQSKKVTLFGQHSAGSIDYVENILLKIPYSYFSVQYPTVRFNSADKRPLNNIGITPHVIISDQVKDWVEYVRIYKAKK